MAHYYVTFESIQKGYLSKDVISPEFAVKEAKKRMGILNARGRLDDDEVQVFEVASDEDGNPNTYTIDDLQLE